MDNVNSLDNFWFLFDNVWLGYVRPLKILKKRLDFIMKCAIIKIDRGRDIKKTSPYKVMNSRPSFFVLRRTLVGVATTTPAGFRFSNEKGTPCYL